MLNTDIISNQFFGRLDRGAGMSQKVVVTSLPICLAKLKQFKTPNGALFVQYFLVAEVCEKSGFFLNINGRNCFQSILSWNYRKSLDCFVADYKVDNWLSHRNRNANAWDTELKSNYIQIYFFSKNRYIWYDIHILKLINK